MEVKEQEEPEKEQEDQWEKEEKKTIEKQGVGEYLILGERAAEGGGGEEAERSKELEKI